MLTQIADAREVAALVAMPRLLGELGFLVNARTRRAPCLLHGGSNPSAFSWREDGRWHCHSCGRGGDRIALVRAVKQCTFREAVGFLSALAGVDFRARRISASEIFHRAHERERAERSAWRITDEIGRLRRYYTDWLHRTERLEARIGDHLLRATGEAAREEVWESLARLIPAGTFFFAAWNFVWDATPDTLARFALASAAERRRFILEGGDVADRSAA